MVKKNNKTVFPYSQYQRNFYLQKILFWYNLIVKF